MSYAAAMRKNPLNPQQAIEEHQQEMLYQQQQQQLQAQQQQQQQYWYQQQHFGFGMAPPGHYWDDYSYSWQPVGGHFGKGKGGLIEQNKGKGKGILNMPGSYFPSTGSGPSGVPSTTQHDTKSVDKDKLKKPVFDDDDVSSSDEENAMKKLDKKFASSAPSDKSKASASQSISKKNSSSAKKPPGGGNFFLNHLLSRPPTAPGTASGRNQTAEPPKSASARSQSAAALSESSMASPRVAVSDVVQRKGGIIIAKNHYSTQPVVDLSQTSYPKSARRAGSNDGGRRATKTVIETSLQFQSLAGRLGLGSAAFQDESIVGTVLPFSKSQIHYSAKRMAATKHHIWHWLNFAFDRQSHMSIQIQNLSASGQ